MVQGTGPYDNQALNYHTAYGGMSFNHFSGSASLTTAEVSINELFNGGLRKEPVTWEKDHTIDYGSDFSDRTSELDYERV
ncbi:hypothetical protein LEP1GSC019_0833 [Leptospira interrogans serovar Pyrogenes str. 2006006960]|nr:hypothetical protein LEP1GSC019_0833 [Leptospira interrogans serovar Pyrogenes str. 2006006960]